MQTEFNLYKIDMKYIRNLHRIDDKVLSVSPQTGKDTRVFVGIVIICGGHQYCIPLSSPKEKHRHMRNSMDFSKIEVNGKLLGVLNYNLMIPIQEAQDGRYSARYYAKSGKRVEKYFDTLPQARRWLADARYEDQHNLLPVSTDMTVDIWFEFWINNLICDLSPNTIRNYRERYQFNIQPILGKMRLCDVKPMHCKAVLNRMEALYAGSTIRQAYITMGTMFRAAVMNGFLSPRQLIRY